MHRTLTMTIDNRFSQKMERSRDSLRDAEKQLHPAWRAFIEHCARLQHGQIEILKIQDGLPVSAEVVRKKIKFG